MRFKTSFLGLFGTFVSCILVFPQENSLSVLSEGIKYQINENSSVSMHFGTQVWTRYTHLNPGTFDVDGGPKDYLFDIGLRRTRFSMYAGFLDDRFIVYTQLGMNSQTFSSNTKPQMFFHDVWSAFNFFDGKLYTGFGLHGWAGVSRLGSVSYSKNIMLDHPGFALPTLGKTDQAGRQVGIFFKGNLAKFNYHFSFDKPFLKDEFQKAGLSKSNYFPNSNNGYKGYVFYSFLDEEKFKSSYLNFSYLGKKKILNLGVGFNYHPGSLASLNASGDTIHHNEQLLGMDVFFDYPFRDKSVLTVYAGTFFYDFGPNHLRTYGPMNPLPRGKLQQGGGNAHFNVGTGTILYSLAGYVLPALWQPLPGKFQPVAAVHVKDFDALAEASLQLDAGLNYYVSGHNAKLTLQYSTWAVYTGTPGYQSDAIVDGTRSSVTFQVQMYL